MSSAKHVVLILTHSADHYTVEHVERALLERGVRSFRLDTDLFPERVRLSANLRSGTLEYRIEDEDQVLETSEVLSVWARRLWPPKLDESLDARFRDGCTRESGAAMLGFLDGMYAARWVNPMSATRQAENKLHQLRLAREVGLGIPRTLVTNDAEQVRSLYRELGGAMVAKMLTPLSVSMGRAPAFVRTSEVREDDLESAETLRYSPMIFQERIAKQIELRVVHVGGELFVGAIDASRSVAGQVDWRAATPEETAWERAGLPDDVATMVRQLHKRLGLSYGAVDMIRTPAGEHVFLELNPGGEWGMLERELELPISRALAKELLESDE